jgi:regulator of sigma D
LKDLTKYFLQKDILFKEINPVLPKDLGSRKKIDIFVATSLSKEYYAIFVIDAKSRFIKKNAFDLDELCTKLTDFIEHNFKKKELLISSPICSKAKKYLEEQSWSVRVDFM